jgi:hypothetical protein
MAKRKTRADYSERFQQVFGTNPRPAGTTASEDSSQPNATTGGTEEKSARPLPDRSAGGYLLTAQDVVHGLLNLREITDPDRWLKRHNAPVALAAGGVKRYVAAETLRWAAERFSPNEQGKRALLAIAESLERTDAV